MIGVGLIQLIDEQAAGGGGAVLPGTGEERTAEREGGEGGKWTACRSLLLRHRASCTSSGV